MSSDKNKVIRPTETNGKLRRGLIVGISVVLLTGFFSMQGWMIRMDIDSQTDRAGFRETLNSIDGKLDNHIEGEMIINDTQDERLKDLEDGNHPSTADRWTKESALLLDEKDKHWSDNRFRRK